MVEVCVVIPFYKGLNELAELSNRLETSLSGSFSSWRVVLVDDRSPDDGWEKIKEICLEDNRFLGIRLSRNFGQHAAISAGLNQVDAKWYVVMDCDLQDMPEHIPLMYSEVRDRGVECCIAHRQGRSHNFIRRLGSRYFNSAMAWLTGANYNSNLGNFRIFSRTMRQEFLKFGEQFRFFPSLMSYLGFEVCTLDLPRALRVETPSSYTFRKLLNLALENLLNHSGKPLKIAALFGAGLTVISLVLFIAYAFSVLAGLILVPGFATVVLLLLGFFGVQIFLTAIVGLYVGNVLKETKGRPLFIIDERLDD